MQASIYVIRVTLEGLYRVSRMETDGVVHVLIEAAYEVLGKGVSRRLCTGTAVEGADVKPIASSARRYSKSLRTVVDTPNYVAEKFYVRLCICLRTDSHRSGEVIDLQCRTWET